MIHNCVFNFEDWYKKVDLTENLRQLSNTGGGIETKDRKGISLLYELTKSASIDCPDKVVRLYFLIFIKSEVEG